MDYTITTMNAYPILPSDARSDEADEMAEVLAMSAEMDALDADEARAFAMDGAGYDETTGEIHDADNPSPARACSCCNEDLTDASFPYVRKGFHGEHYCAPCYSSYGE